MAERPLSRCSLVADGIVLVILIILLSSMELPSVHPAVRGFYCDDISIRYPYHDGTISTPVLLIVTVVLPVFMVLIVELVHFYRPGSNRSPHRTTVFGKRIPPVVYTSLSYLSLYMFGCLATGFLTEVGKVMVGRLRPHFLDKCQPDVNITQCDNRHTYIEGYTCMGLDRSRIEDARKSFPSGHASVSMYCSLFLILYLSQRLPRMPGFRLLIPFIQLICLLWTWATGLSRYLDNKHHATDILSGYVIGIAIAFASAHHSGWFRDPLNSGQSDCESSIPLKGARPVPSSSDPSESTGGQVTQVNELSPQQNPA